MTSRARLAILAACLLGCARNNQSELMNRPDGEPVGPVLDVSDAGDVPSSVPRTCAEAALARSYLGCEFWPTVTLNAVWSIFDFAVVVANFGDQPAEIEVSGPDGRVLSSSVPPRGLSNIYLPWVPELKGADSNSCGMPATLTESIFVERAAFHLTSSLPVIVNQFNALEFRSAGGPEGKDWSECPGLTDCVQPDGTKGKNGCFSFSNDAAILLPASALTGNYRVTAMPPTNSQQFVAITGTQDATNVNVRLGSSAHVLAGGPVAAAAAGDSLQLLLNAGDVVELVSADPLLAPNADLSGSLIQADRPVQVIAGAPCAALPASIGLGTPTTCDHLEESVLPAETLGARYVVPRPTGVFGTPVPHFVRLYGNVDGTELSYPGGAPRGAPTRLDAGQVVDLPELAEDFEVVATNEILVSTFLLSADVVDPGDIIGRGDPSQSQAVTVEQFRTDYVFLAPDDYDVNYVDIVMPLDASVVLDEQALPGAPQPIGSSDFGVARVRLGSGDRGAHFLVSDKPVGLQVVGYGSYTSYAYPGGLDLRAIAPPPK